MTNDVGGNAFWALAGAAFAAVVGAIGGWFIQHGKNETDDSISIRNEWSKLFEAVSERCQVLEEAEQRCRAELADVKERLAVLEGYQTGVGKARQEAAAIVATERLSDKKP